jgi:hypothetical protein
MTKTVKQPLVAVSAALLLGAAALYAAIIHSMLDDDPTMLLACMEVDARWRGWTCEQVLRHATLTPQQVGELNRRGGVSFPMMMEHAGKAEEMLELFLARGVDINAGNQEAQNWTALHSRASESNADRARLLLKHGARADVRTLGGIRPLDIARKAQKRHPDNPAATEMIDLLEAEERKLAQ